MRSSGQLRTGADRDGQERQNFFIGQVPQRGFRALQTVAPKSMSAWLKSNTCLRGTSVSEMAHSIFLVACARGSPSATNMRKRTRATLVSRIAARCPKAKLRIAPAVYAPMPLNESSVVSSDGSSPPYRVTDSFAIA